MSSTPAAVLGSLGSLECSQSMSTTSLMYMAQRETIGTNKQFKLCDRENECAASRPAAKRLR